MGFEEHNSLEGDLGKEDIFHIRQQVQLELINHSCRYSANPEVCAHEWVKNHAGEYATVFEVTAKERPDLLSKIDELTSILEHELEKLHERASS